MLSASDGFVYYYGGFCKVPTVRVAIDVSHDLNAYGCCSSASLEAPRSDSSYAWGWDSGWDSPQKTRRVLRNG